jgi:hypothetical protein
MEGGGEQQRYVRVICVNTVETWERHTRQAELPYHILNEIRCACRTTNMYLKCAPTIGFPTKFLSQFVCVPLRITWLYITSTQN